MTRQRALLVNDDGYKAAGLRALIAQMQQDFDVVAVAPEREQSWMAKSISAHHELHMTPVSYHEFTGFQVNGTPADCTQLGIYETEQRPDLVVSGINHGANVGHGHITSSGTVGAALEAAFLGVPAFAVSVYGARKAANGQDLHGKETVDVFRTPARIAEQIIKKIMATGFPVQAQVIAINMAADVAADARWAVTHPHTVPYGQLFEKQASGGYANIIRSEYSLEAIQHTDLAAVKQGLVSIVPLTITLTSEMGQAELAELLKIDIFAEN
jgi:5'-nucleotidase